MWTIIIKQYTETGILHPSQQTPIVTAHRPQTQHITNMVTTTANSETYIRGPKSTEPKELYGLYYDYVNNVIYKIYDEFDSDLTNIAAEDHNINIMTEIFNKYYRLYIENDGNNYLKEIYPLYNSRKISLHKVLNRNPTNRINIFDMLNHECNDMISIHGERVNFHSACDDTNMSSSCNIFELKLYKWE